MITKKNVFYILAFICIFVSACVSFELFNFKSHGCLSGIELATGNYTIQSQNITREYHLRLPDDYGTGKCYPLVIGLHGTGGHFRTFVEDEYYNIQGSVGEEAILVFPNALDNGAGVSQWDYVRDLTFFDDLYAELEETLCFDPRKVFATGHSSGAGFAQTLGCERGNILRGIVPVAGALVDNTGCIGQVAVMQIQGSKDIIVPPTMVRSSYRYWAAINSCSQDFVPAEAPYCDEFINCDENFPVQYCEHDLEEGSGHAWPDFAGPAIWDFFGSLPAAVQSEKKGTGKFFSSILGQISFKVNWPDDFTGTPVKLAIALYPPGIDYTQPVLVSPTYILNPNVALGDYTFGEVYEYENITTELFGVDVPGDYVMSIVVYVAGGSYPIPTTGKDYSGYQDITLDSNTIVLETPFDLDFLDSF